MADIYEDYERIEQLGSGAYATVFKVRHKKLGHVRAIRELDKPIALGKNDPLWKKFQEECKVLLRLGNGVHQNIIRIHEPQLHGDKAFVIMDYIEGLNLEEYIRSQKGFVEINEIIRFVKEMGSALSYCHYDIYRHCMDRKKDNLQDDPNDGSRVIMTNDKRAELVKKYRVIHNDLHTGNIMRRDTGGYVLLDFGLSIQDGDVLRSSRMHGGAPEYKAPEKWDNDAIITPQTDIYSFGVILYEMLTGRVPFQIKDNSLASLANLMNSIKSGSVPSTYEMRKQAFERVHPGKVYRKDYPDWLDEVVSRCLSKDPSKRFADGHQLNEVVEKKSAGIQTIIRPIKDRDSNPPAQAQPKPKPQTRQTRKKPVPKKKNNNNHIKNVLKKLWRGFVITIMFAFSVDIIFFQGFGTAYIGAHIGISRLQVILGNMYDKKGEYDKALKYHQLAADKGDKYGQCNLGVYYLHGTGVDKSLDSAYKYLTMSANQGIERANYYLGEYYFEKRDTVEAIKQYKIAATQEYAPAQNILGYCYFKGIGVTQSFEKAVEYFKLAAEQDDWDAQTWLGFCYYEGYGVPKSFTQAAKHYEKAADEDYAEAQRLLGECYFKGEGVTWSYAKAAELYEKAANNGDVEAMYLLGDCYYTGKGKHTSYTEAVRYFIIAAEKNNSKAQNRLGLCYEKGIGVEKSEKIALNYYKLASEDYPAALYNYGRLTFKDSHSQAIECYKKAANKGCPEAQCDLGDMYYDGKYLPKSENKAAKYYSLAANQGFAIAQNKLGVLYYNHKKYTEAAQLFEKAARQGNVNAEYNLGNCYYKGNGVSKSLHDAIEWYEKAARKGHEEAKKQLRELGRSV